MTKEERRDYFREYCARNREKMREYFRRYRQTNREKMREYGREYWKRHSLEIKIRRILGPSGD